MKEIVFLLEEPSAKEVLQNILPQILPKDDVSYLCIPHQGKRDLILIAENFLELNRAGFAQADGFQ